MHHLAASGNQLCVGSGQSQPCTGIVLIESVCCRVDDHHDRVFVGAITRRLGVARQKADANADNGRRCDSLDSIHGTSSLRIAA